MRRLPPLTREKHRACAAINLKLLHKFEKAKRKRFRSVGRYVFEVSYICYLASSNIKPFRSVSKCIYFLFSITSSINSATIAEEFTHSFA